MIAAVPVELTDEVLASDVADGLARVEEGLRRALKSQHPVLAAASAHLMEAGGKRLRPMLVLLAAHFGDPQDPRVVQAAVALMSVILTEAGVASATLRLPAPTMSAAQARLILRAGVK